MTGYIVSMDIFMFLNIKEETKRVNCKLKCFQQKSSLSVYLPNFCLKVPTLIYQSLIINSIYLLPFFQVPLLIDSVIFHLSHWKDLDINLFFVFFGGVSVF